MTVTISTKGSTDPNANMTRRQEHKNPFLPHRLDTRDAYDGSLSLTNSRKRAILHTQPPHRSDPPITTLSTLGDP